MPFDSHVTNLLATLVRLVNVATPGEDGGRSYVVPDPPELAKVIAEALGTDTVTRAQATALAALAVRVREVITCLAEGDDDRAALLVNGLLAETEARPHLDPGAEGGWTLHFHGPDVTLVRGWSAGIAAGLAVAMGSDLAGRLGVCAATGCDRVQVDASRNGVRRFCSTRCQNRTKAAAHRARHA